MTDFIKTDSLRRALIAGVAALTLAACSGGDKPTTSTATGSNSEFLVPNDHVTGNADAVVTLVEYASVACGACAGWHQQVYPEFKKKYAGLSMGFAGSQAEMMESFQALLQYYAVAMLVVFALWRF